MKRPSTNKYKNGRHFQSTGMVRRDGHDYVAVTEHSDVVREVMESVDVVSRVLRARKVPVSVKAQHGKRVIRTTAIGNALLRLLKRPNSVVQFDERRFKIHPYAECFQKVAKASTMGFVTPEALTTAIDQLRRQCSMHKVRNQVDDDKRTFRLRAAKIRHFLAALRKSHPQAVALRLDLGYMVRLPDGDPVPLPYVVPHRKFFLRELRKRLKAQLAGYLWHTAFDVRLGHSNQVFLLFDGDLSFDTYAAVEDLKETWIDDITAGRGFVLDWCNSPYYNATALFGSALRDDNSWQRLAQHCIHSVRSDLFVHAASNPKQTFNTAGPFKTSGTIPRQSGPQRSADANFRQRWNLFGNQPAAYRSKRYVPAGTR